MPIVNYSKTIIYQLTCKDTSVKYYYIGSTTDIHQIKSRHSRQLGGISYNELYTTITENGGWDNWNFTIIERYTTCTSKDDSNARVIYWENRNKINQAISTESPPILHQYPPISTDSPPISTTSPDAVTKIKNKLQCQHCSTIFSRTDALKRHIATRCKEIKDQANQLQIANNNAVTNSVVSSNNNNNLINSNNNNTINNTVNNTINYKVQIGNETVADRLTDREKRNILSKMHNSLPYYLDIVHFSGEYPECMNVHHTNLRSKYTKTYSEEHQKFVDEPSCEVFSDLLENRVAELHGFYNDVSMQLIPKHRNIILEVIEGLKNDAKKIKNAKLRLTLIAYRNREKVNTKDCRNIEEDHYDHEAEAELIELLENT